MPNVNLDSLLSSTAQKLENFKKDFNETAPEDRGVVLTDIMATIAVASTAVSKEITQKKTVSISKGTVQAIYDALKKLQEDPSTINKVNAVQIALFATDAPFLNMLEEMTSLILTIESLKDSRGKRAARVSETST